MPNDAARRAITTAAPEGRKVLHSPFRPPGAIFRAWRISRLAHSPQFRLCVLPMILK
jgi:hypothetical protein